MESVLVANRGEIALRVFRTARRLAMKCVAVYSDADAGSPHVRAADRAIRLGGAPATESYLSIERLIEAALETRATFLHPGYGFLSESPELSEACRDAGIAFVGPTPETLRALGDKASSRVLAVSAGVRVLPGATTTAEALEIGFPLIVKPAAGGGGKGMRVVNSDDELGDAFEFASRAGAASFGDDSVVFEKYLEAPRHIEVQIMGDTHGTVIHFGERDCSAQRRHQKVLEETPAPNLERELRDALCADALKLAHASNYVSAGTCEFVVGSDGEYGFIEANARLQVEHPVTEEVTGVDLVELQLLVARGEKLPLGQGDVKFSGHSIEARVYAEDPAEGFLPQAGKIVHLRWPKDVRVDAAVEEGSEISTYYDPMVAKIIAHGATREEALSRLASALDKSEILGVRTNLAFLGELVRSTVVRAGRVTTNFIEEGLRTGELAARDSAAELRAVAAVAASEAKKLKALSRSTDVWSSLSGWRGSSPSVAAGFTIVGSEEFFASVSGSDPFEVRINSLKYKVQSDGGEWLVDGTAVVIRPNESVPNELAVLVWAGAQVELRVGASARHIDDEIAAHLVAPMPGTVIAIRAALGDEVLKGQELVVVEAMKMEHAIVSPFDGCIAAVNCSVGDQVSRGLVLVDVAPADRGQH